jgi:hypothetical protein
MSTTITESMPTPAQIRGRLSELATEANWLRSLLRVVERSPSDRPATPPPWSAPADGEDRRAVG